MMITSLTILTISLFIQSKSMTVVFQPSDLILNLHCTNKKFFSIFRTSVSCVFFSRVFHEMVYFVFAFYIEDNALFRFLKNENQPNFKRIVHGQKKFFEFSDPVFLVYSLPRNRTVYFVWVSEPVHIEKNAINIIFLDRIRIKFLSVQVSDIIFLYEEKPRRSCQFQDRIQKMYFFRYVAAKIYENRNQNYLSQNS